MEKRKMPVAVGIDLGTTNSCVGWWSNGQVHIIPNEHGNRTTPSFVAFRGNERIVGEDAKNISDNSVIIYESKRFMGRTFSELNNLKKLSYELIDMGDDRPCFHICPMNDRPMNNGSMNEPKQMFYYPEEIAAMILSKMKNIAEIKINEPVKRTVITVPAYFNDAQRQATRDAGHIAGLEVLRIINEPTAAAIAYGLDRKTKELSREINVMVFDLGGGTLDTSLLTITPDGVFEVRAIAGDTQLGGADFDNRLMDYCLDQINMKQINRYELRTKCEEAKCQLSTHETVDIILEDSNIISITKKEFEEMCDDLFKRCMDCVKKTLSDAGMLPHQIHDVVLVGGSTRIPKVQEMLSIYFANPQTLQPRELCKSINPDEAVAFGASIQAAMLNYSNDDLNDDSNNVTNDTTNDDTMYDDKLPDYVLLDVNPLSLGIETTGQIMNILIPRNTTIPIAKTKMFSTVEDNQTAVTISVYEGERTLTQHNRLLGQFELSGIELQPRGEPQIEVTFEIDADGIFTVHASVNSSSNSSSNSSNPTNVVQKTLQIKKSKHTSDYVEQMIANAKQYEEEDKKYKEFIRYRTQYTNLIHTMKKLLLMPISTDEKETIETLLIENEVENEMDNGVENKNKKNYVEKYEQLVKIIQPIIDNLK